MNCRSSMSYASPERKLEGLVRPLMGRILTVFSPITAVHCQGWKQAPMQCDLSLSIAASVFSLEMPLMPHSVSLGKMTPSPQQRADRGALSPRSQFFMLTSRVAAVVSTECVLLVSQCGWVGRDLLPPLWTLSCTSPAIFSTPLDSHISDPG